VVPPRSVPPDGVAALLPEPVELGAALSEESALGEDDSVLPEEELGEEADPLLPDVLGEADSVLPEVLGDADSVLPEVLGDADPVLSEARSVAPPVDSVGAACSVLPPEPRPPSRPLAPASWSAEATSSGDAAWVLVGRVSSGSPGAIGTEPARPSAGEAGAWSNAFWPDWSC
jgi:hypothetical protein